MAQTTLRDFLQSTEDAISANRIDSALSNCQQILNYFPESLEAQRLLGEVYLKQGYLDEAQQTFDWVLSNDPENVVVYCDRALISERRSDFDIALDCYQQAYELSRGNRGIRQQFNQLSAKVGQQGFMFSRAGLARLYMRGDLLPQAIQEWEAVLNTSPDRLDARTGLLEAYWREGLYQQVQELASQLLEDVPGCLKALLLLAHVTFSDQRENAQELLERAATLDPEMVMAQTLFTDLIARQPNDPFMALLEKEPLPFPPVSHLNGQSPPTATVMPSEQNSTTFGASALPDTSSSPDFSWERMNTIPPLQPESSPPPTWTTPANASSASSTSSADPWAYLEQQDYPPTQEASPLATWSGLGKTSETGDPWAALPLPPEQPVENRAKQQPESYEPLPEIGQALSAQPQSMSNLDPAVAHDQALLEQQPWYHMAHLTAPSAETSDPWSSTPPFADAPPMDRGSMQPREETLPTPPAWLDRLTRGEPRQPSGSLPAHTPSAPLQTPAENLPPAHEDSLAPMQAPLAPTPAARSNAQVPSLAQEEEVFPFAVASEEDDIDMGWPEWLKSLGAATIDQPSPTEEAAPVPPSKPTPPAPAPAESTPVAPPAPQMPSELAPSWMNQLNLPPSSREEESEQQVLMTLENLDRDLLSQGFMPLEHGALSTFAQEPTFSATTSDLDMPINSPAEVPSMPPMSPAQPAEPLWAATLGPLSPVSHQPTTASGKPELGSVRINEEQKSQGKVSNTPSPARPLQQPPPPSALPAKSFEELLESELETTMKRPAIRLQPMQLPSVAKNQAGLISKGRGGEYAPTPMSKPADTPNSDKERLVRGYQYQLAGAYDDAMQEYRILIRSAPELLGEVISNMRALLKLAPKYSAGYRVLGDAYMRQGEYLQAMEAYNKALTMAKKAKG